MMCTYLENIDEIEFGVRKKVNSMGHRKDRMGDWGYAARHLDGVDIAPHDARGRRQLRVEGDGVDVPCTPRVRRI